MAQAAKHQTDEFEYVGDVPTILRDAALEVEGRGPNWRVHRIAFEPNKGPLLVLTLRKDT